MFNQIDITKKPYKPQLFLCKPNRSIIGKLNRTFNASLIVSLGKPNELSFDVSYMIDIRHSFERNPNIDNLRAQYLIKLVYGNFSDWFVIDKITEAMSKDDKKTVHAYSLDYQLQNKRIRNLQQDSLTATQQLTQVLSATTWKIGYVDPSLDLLYRGLNISSSTVLESINTIATTFNNYLVTFDTENKLVNLLVPDNFGKNKGLVFKYGKYLKTLGNAIDTSNMVTELKAYGQNNLTIGAVNPTGGDSIINLDFFLQGFEQDSNGNVISSSPYMSDSLCQAITTYNNLIVSKTDEYKSLLATLTTQQQTLTSKQNDLQSLKDQLAIINDNLDLQRSQKTLSIYSFTYKGSSVIKTTQIDPSSYYLVMLNVSSTSNLTVNLDGANQSLPSNTWTGWKIANQTSTTLNFSGSNTNVVVNAYVVQITSDEYSGGDITDLLNKYNDNYEQGLINSKQTEVNSAQNDVNNTQSQINTIVTSLSLANNFTSDQIEERDAFIITQEWSDSNYIDAQSLYDAAVKQLQQLQSPPTAITIDVVNFMEVIESQREWNKLVLGDQVTIKYDLFKLDAKAQISEIQYDFENVSIKLTISNVTEVKDDKKKFMKNYYAGIMASKTIEMSQYQWNTATDANTKIDNYINNPIDTSKQPILAGVNNSVQIDSRGITYTDPTNSNNKVIAQAGQVSYSTDGGTSWKTAMTAEGTQAEQLIGKIILAEVLQMQNSSGNMTFDDNGLTMTTTDNTKRVLINEGDGIKIQQSSDGGTTWNDQFYADANGQLTINGMSIRTADGTDVIIDAKNKTIDFSQFATILGTISFDNAKGGTLTLGGVGNGNGVLVIYDANGNTIAQFDSSTGGFDNLTVTNLTSQSVVNQNLNDQSYSLSGGVQSTIQSIPSFNEGKITITLTADTTESLTILSFSGGGTIEINLNGHSINGDININGNTNIIYIHGGNINGTGKTGVATVFVGSSTFVQLDNLTVNSNGDRHALQVSSGGKCSTSSSSYYNTTDDLVRVSDTSIIYMNTCSGSSSVTTSGYGLAAYQGGIALITGSTPSTTNGQTYAGTGGFINGSATASSGTATTVSPSPSTKNWTSISANAYSSSGYWDNGNQAKQGNYGYGRRTGLFFFDSSLSSTLSGKTISNMQVYLYRPSTGGSSGATTIYIHTHNYSTTPSGSPTIDTANTVTMSIPWGGSGWVTLPSSMYSQFSSGSAKGIGIYVASDSSSYYAVFNGTDCKVKVTYS